MLVKTSGLLVGNLTNWGTAAWVGLIGLMVAANILKLGVLGSVEIGLDGDDNNFCVVVLDVVVVVVVVVDIFGVVLLTAWSSFRAVKLSN